MMLPVCTLALHPSAILRTHGLPTLYTLLHPKLVSSFYTIHIHIPSFWNFYLLVYSVVCRTLQSTTFGNVELEIVPLCECSCNDETVRLYYIA